MNIAARVSSLVALSALAAACSSAPLEPASVEKGATDPSLSAEATGQWHPVQIMRWRDSSESDYPGRRPFTAPSGAHLTYYDGRVISNVQVVQVLYGGTQSQYASGVFSTTTPSLATFYGGVTNSAYFDWLTEYNTTASGGTHQTIGRGTFLQQVQITPSSANNGSTIDDSNIQNELAAQLAAGHLPAPTSDAAGNRNTVYMVNFPHGKSITQGGAGSCVANGFCAYHGTMTVSGQDIYYGVLPDMQAGSGCDTGCGTGTAFQNQTSVASHELIESVTDAEVGIAPNLAAPLAWYDSTNGEIGDICNGQQGTVAGGDGVTYTVQQEFSNVANNCIVTRPVAGNDFSIAVSPASVSVAAGASATDTVSTAVTSGSAESISLGVSGLPTGASASFSPSSVTSGASSTLTITAASTVAPGTYSLSVTGTATSGSRSAGLSLTVTGSSGGGITNGGFETGNFSGWTASGAATTVVSSGAHSGTYAAQLGNTTPTNGDSWIAQTFTAPTGTTGLAFWFKMTCPDTVQYDWATATLKDNTSGTSTTPLTKVCTTNAWTQVTASVTAGHSYTITLTSHDDNYSADPSYTLFDDVALTSAPPPPPPPPTNAITNGGFESGTLSGWTTSGASATVVSSGAHSGTYAAELGKTTPTNGDSSIAQTFTAPTGSSTLTFWYKMTCPDTVQYDWATATLRDNTAATTTTVLAKVCTTNAWTQASAAITAGHSYTITLTSHDDNYSADPSYTLCDDVSTQ